MENIALQEQQPVDERVAWGQWLMSTCLRVPSAHFQQYQRDTFEATLRWIPREPTVQGRPLSGPSSLPPPQILASTQHTPQPTAAFVQHEGDQPQHVLGWMPPAPQATPAGVVNDHLARPYGYDFFYDYGRVP
ncbi:Hypp3550 [Branchiostoma lanceolatum]|uniref:Hypp3550 protein n=1 Tax=Branchiostoma lanceolatum TaxID=7740 RepID=A0A8K0A006_BRALA|nr:Hypp3550 [Branchiostoma lanceolatum]